MAFYHNGKTHLAIALGVHFCKLKENIVLFDPIFNQRNSKRHRKVTLQQFLKS